MLGWVAMSTEVADIVMQARTLGRKEQARLASEILALLDESDDAPETVEREWAAELSRRAERAEAGLSTARPWSEVREELIARLRQR